MLKLFNCYDRINVISLLIILCQWFGNSKQSPPHYGSLSASVLLNNINDNPGLADMHGLDYKREGEGLDYDAEGFCEPPKEEKPSNCENSNNFVGENKVIDNDIDIIKPQSNTPSSLLHNKYALKEKKKLNTHNLPINLTKILSINIDTREKDAKHSFINQQFALIFLPLTLAFIAVLMLLIVALSPRNNSQKIPFTYFYSKSA